MRRRTLIAGVAATVVQVGQAAPARAQGQPWPSRAVRIVVPFPPGGAADAVPRGIAQHLQSSLQVPFVIENRPGASGAIGAAAVAQAAADGYTFLSHTSGVTVQPHLSSVPFAVLRDFVPVSQTIAGSYVLVVRPDFPAPDLPQFVRAVRAAPGKFAYASHGSGSGPHLAMELLKREAGLFVVHVPFRGAAFALQELLAGRIDMAFETTFAAVPHIRSGSLKAIAVGGPRPVEALAGVATVARTYPGFDTDGWQGFFAPARTPMHIVARMSEGIGQALRSQDLARRVADLGFRPVGTSPGEFAELLRSDHDKWGRIVRERGIRAD